MREPSVTVRVPDPAGYSSTVTATATDIQIDMGYYTTYYAFGLPSFLVIIIALYLLFTGVLFTCITKTKYCTNAMPAQIRERRLMLASSWKSQARLYGLQLALAYALG